MSMSRKIFRPGAGQTHQNFIVAFAEVATYPNDLVGLSTTAPASQGSSGVLEGKTLGDYDYIYADLMDTNATDGAFSVGTQLGVCVGKSINAVSDRTNVINDVVAADTLMVIQNWGITRLVYCDATVAAGAVLTTGTTEAAVTDATTSLLQNHVGLAMATQETYSRAAATDVQGVPAFIRCNF